MLTADDIRTRARQQPFTPFRITTSGGEAFDVTHPDLVMVGRRDVVIGLPSRDDPAVYEQIARVAILHVTSLRDLPQPSAPSADGGGSD